MGLSETCEGTCEILRVRYDRERKKKVFKH